MIKQYLCALCLLGCLLLPTAPLYSEGPDGIAGDSFERLTEKVLSSVNTGLDASVLAMLSIRNTDGRKSALGNYLEERLVDRLITGADVSVVERNQMEQLVEELELSLTGMMADDSMYEIGAMAGADAVLVGMLTRIDQVVQVNLRIIDPETSLVQASVDSLLTEPRYLSMYLDVFDTKVLTDDDYFIGRSRGFDREQTFLEAVVALCNEISAEIGRDDFLDPSFIDFLEASAQVDCTRGSRYSCTVKVRRDQFGPEHLYSFFFSDGRSSTVWYADDENYGWQTNPYFQAQVEQEYPTFGVPEIYREAVSRSAAFAVENEPLDGMDLTIENGIAQYSATGSSAEWALIRALFNTLFVLEIEMEMVTFRSDTGMIDFVANYIPLENLERSLETLTILSIDPVGQAFSATVRVDAAEILQE